MKQPITTTNPKGAGRNPAHLESKTLQIRSVPIHLHEKIKEYVKNLVHL